MTFENYFEAATAVKPYPYQKRLATADDLSPLVRVPTAAGKTAAIVLGWLWRRQFSGSEATRLSTPRRLVYVLPMRALVEQTRAAAVGWLDRLGMLAGQTTWETTSTDRRLVDYRPVPGPKAPAGGWAAENGGSRVAVHTLMGGEPTEDWDLYPERDAVLIGTQDMILSRALNRGYAASRFHWPIDFGLLNNDCLWVFDEPQLMGNGVATSAQLAGLRSKLTTFGPCPSVWMSATLEPGWFRTVDLPDGPSDKLFELTEDDYTPKLPLHRRMTAEKILHRLDGTTSKDVKNFARCVVKEHIPGTQTLVIVNTVGRAKELYEALSGDGKKLKEIVLERLLIHSRFRPAEREDLNKRLMQGGQDRIIIATQVVEAGVDVSARTLLSELAPWPSLVQRMGRCNRAGIDGPGRVFWVDLDETKLAAPYNPGDMSLARKRLQKLEGRLVSPKALEDFGREEGITLPFEHDHVLRRRDLLDLFDTTPDLSGNDVDVSRFVRGDQDSDVQVYWRRSDPDDSATQSEAVQLRDGPDRREMCRVPIGKFKDFLKKERKGGRPAAYFWDHLDRQWRKVRPLEMDREVFPGRVFRLPTASGGYSSLLGWDESTTDAVVDVSGGQGRESEGTDDDLETQGGMELTIAVHTSNVCSQLESILDSLGPMLDRHRDTLTSAARWHDVGKGHWAFQKGMQRANPGLDSSVLWAKSGTNRRLEHGRKYFRHELASALAALQHGHGFEVAYLIATHHGKVRLSIRALPGEDLPDDPSLMFAQGVHHKDRLPEVNLGEALCPSIELDLTPMRLGGPESWTARALALRDDLGSFRLAYLEALLCAADRRASALEREGCRMETQS